MKLTHVLSLSLLCGTCACASRPASLESITLEMREAPQEDAASQGEKKKVPSMMEMMALGMPGEEHKELAKLAGEWELELSMWMPPGGQEPMKMKGRGEIEMILGGRFLQTRSSSTMMGMKTEQLGFLGFDRRNETYTTYGMDTMGTYGVSGAGKREEDGVIRLHGRDKEPWGDQVYTFEMDFVNDDQFKHSVWFTEMGGMKFDEPFKMVEVLWTRSASEGDVEDHDESEEK